MCQNLYMLSEISLQNILFQKINVKNAFNLQLIDCMSEMLRKKDPEMNNFQVNGKFEEIPISVTLNSTVFLGSKLYIGCQHKNLCLPSGLCP